MAFNKFLFCVKEITQQKLGMDYKVKLTKVTKNNGIELDALVISREDSKISPTIYMDYYYEEYKKGNKPLESIVEDIILVYRDNCSGEFIDMECFTNFEKMKDKIVFKLINIKTNEKLLESIPFKKVLDLAMVFYCVVDEKQSGNATVLINDVHMDMWGITLRQLVKIAKENTPRIMKFQIKNMEDMLRGMLNVGELCMVREGGNEYEVDYDEKTSDNYTEDIIKEIKDNNSMELFVLTNTQKINGAACMIYDNVLEGFSKSINNNFYILPSSVHEVILVPESENVCKEVLEKMVKDVNRTEVDTVDVLSDTVYYYDKGKHTIKIA